MVLRGVGEKEKGASRKESEKAGGLRCSGAADTQREREREKDNVLYVLSVHNFKFHGVEIKTSTNIGKYM